MTKEYFNFVTKVLEERGEQNFLEFLKLMFMSCENEKTIKIEGYHENKEENFKKEGTAWQMQLNFNERFPDFDFYISLKEDYLSYGILNITNDDIYIIKKNKYALKREYYELHIEAQL